MKSPKVALFIDSSDPGGAETLVIDLAVAYKSRGVDVEIWHFGNEWLQQAAADHDLVQIKLDDRYFRRFYRLPMFGVYLSRMLRQRGITVAHSHLYGAVIGAALGTFLSATRHVVTLHDVYTLLDGRSRLWPLRLAAWLRTKIVCVSSVIEETIRDGSHAGWPGLTTIHNGIHVDVVGPGSAERDWQAERTEFICVARLVPVKNIDALIRAAGILKRGAGLFRLRIVGDGPLRSELEQLADEHGVADDIEFSGFRPDVDNLLSRSHCFVLPSRSEGLSCSIMEAMRAGLPVVATDVGGNHELVDDGRTGILVAPDDLKALASALQRVLDSRQWARDAGRGGRERVIQEFSFARMLDAYWELYEGLS